MADLIIPPRYRERHRQGMQRYLATGEAHVLGRKIEIESDALKWLGVPGGARNRAGCRSQGRLFHAYIRDLTERKRLRPDQARLLRESEEAISAKSEFSRRLSHELRTPPNAISGYTELSRWG